MRRAPALDLDAVLSDLLGSPGGTDTGPAAPDAGGHHPDAGGHHPGAGGHHPGAGGHHPDAGGHHPDAGGHHPGAGGHHADAGGHHPGAGGRRVDAATDGLLDATSALLAEHGTRGWTVDDAAVRAGVGRATVYRRFAGRDDLVRAAITRDAGRFFAAIAQAVAATEPLEEKVVNGFLTGLRLARRSSLAALLCTDPPGALSLLTSESLLNTAVTALADRYETLLGAPLGPSGRARAEVVAEALIRLGLSFVLMPGLVGDAGDDSRARERLGAMISPLITGRD